MAMPEVKKCTVAQCFYNEENLCHAPAIQVGSPCPMCDTFINVNKHAEPASMGRVGACHQADCEYNQVLTCNAPGIEVGWHGAHADCFTYERIEGKKV
jgi:hypothetical protein